MMTLTSKHDPRITYIVRKGTGDFKQEVIDHKGRVHEGYTIDQAYSAAEDHLMSEPMMTASAIREWLDYRDDLLGLYEVAA